MTKKFDRTNYQPLNTAADLKQRIADKVDQIAQLTDQALFSEAVQSYLRTMTRFHTYSFGNQILIWITNPDATLVAGFHDWQKKFNRHVKKGEKGIPILAPFLVPDEEASAKTGRDIKKVVGFKVVYVFDISQTEGDDLPEQPNWKSLAKSAELDAATAAYAKDLGIIVTVKELAGETQGISHKGSIDLAATAGTKTAFHELAHEILHDGWARRTLTHTAIELEAEATAWVVSEHFGLDAVGCPNYLALTGATAEMIRQHLDAIAAAASQIIEGIEAHL